jgi:hypothetical protein
VNRAKEADNTIMLRSTRPTRLYFYIGEPINYNTVFYFAEPYPRIYLVF